MKNSIIILLLLLGLGSIRAAESDFYTVEMKIEGVNYKLDLLHKDLEKTLLWKLGSGEPPILPNAAYIKALEALKKFRKADWQQWVNEDSMSIVAVEINGLRRNFYMFAFTPPSNVLPKNGKVDSLQIAVLMDGHVVAPEPK